MKNVRCAQSRKFHPNPACAVDRVGSSTTINACNRRSNSPFAPSHGFTYSGRSEVTTPPTRTPPSTCTAKKLAMSKNCVNLRSPQAVTHHLRQLFPSGGYPVLLANHQHVYRCSNKSHARSRVSIIVAILGFNLLSLFMNGPICQESRGHASLQVFNWIRAVHF